MASQVSTSRPLVSFTEYNKMSPSLVELRVDYHLNRIMKSYRLNNFANAIKALPLQSRICEKLIEILVSCDVHKRLGLFTFSSLELFGEHDRPQVGKDQGRQRDAGTLERSC